MAGPDLTIDLDAIVANWKALDRMSAASVETAAVVKADGYGLGADRVVSSLRRAGARSFFVAITEEGPAIRRAAGTDAEIYVFSGHMDGDARVLADHGLTPLLNSPQQVQRHLTSLPDHPFGLQIDTGMRRLGMNSGEFASVRHAIDPEKPRLVVSHLACSDDKTDPRNQAQLAAFREMTAAFPAPRSLSATGGILLGREFHFDLCRPGIGLFGGAPFRAGIPAVVLDVPVIQARDLSIGDYVGYGADWTAKRTSRIATIAVGYADGLLRVMGNDGLLSCWVGDTRCPVVGRISMDLITIDITDIEGTPERVQVLNEHQAIDDLAEIAGTIGYEVLTTLGQRIRRRYIGG